MEHEQVDGVIYEYFWWCSHDEVGDGVPTVVVNVVFFVDKYLKKSFVLSLDRKKYGFNAIEIYRISLRDCVTIDEKSCKPKTFKDKIFKFYQKSFEYPNISFETKIIYRVCCYGGDKKPFCKFELNENEDFEKIFKLQELGVHNNAVCR